MSLDGNEVAFILRQRVARLGTADLASGQPHVVPICFALIDEAVYFVIDRKPKRSTRGLRRLVNIQSNPRVSLLWDEYDDDWAKLSFLLAFGEGQIVDSQEEWDRAVAALRARYAGYAQMELRFDENPVVRVRILRHHFWRMAPTER